VKSKEFDQKVEIKLPAIERPICIKKQEPQ